mmetsp:Transcript_23434/g.48785  ORF Transcript_23434/g.48785 Transcript_23434/m.48785 type:complete len:86 (+) Transcript_23434:721-978(+)
MIFAAKQTQEEDGRSEWDNSEVSMDLFCASLVKLPILFLFIPSIPAIDAAPNDTSSYSDINDEAKPIGERDYDSPADGTLLVYCG